MQQHPPTGHENHDPMLIARLYGGDVSAAERQQALALMGDCTDCAQLFADLGAISEGTTFLPTPPRPRDFTLTDVDAARLGRPAGEAVGARGRFGWLGLRRSLGGALAGLGLVGVLLSGTSSFMSSAAHTNDRAAMDLGTTTGQAAPATAQPANGAGQPDVTASGFGPASTVAPAIVAAASPVPAAATSTGQTDKSVGGASGNTPPNGGGALTPATEAASATPQGGEYGYDNGQGSKAATSGSSVDSRLLGFAGFGLALLIGLALLVGPRFVRVAGGIVRR